MPYIRALVQLAKGEAYCSRMSYRLYSVYPLSFSKCIDWDLDFAPVMVLAHRSRGIFFEGHLIVPSLLKTVTAEACFAMPRGLDGLGSVANR